MRRLASFATAPWQSGHRKQYEPRSSSAHTRTVRSSAVSCTSPQLGQFARIVVTAPSPSLVVMEPTFAGCFPSCVGTALPFGTPWGPLESV